jgi:hypothetical protein
MARLNTSSLGTEVPFADLSFRFSTNLLVENMRLFNFGNFWSCADNDFFSLGIYKRSLKL